MTDRKFYYLVSIYPTSMLSLQSQALLIGQLFNDQPESVLWVAPVHKPRAHIIDFKIGYCNSACAQWMNTTKEQVCKCRILKDKLLDASLRKLLFDSCIKILETGKNWQHAGYNDYFEKYFFLSGVRFQQGVLITIKDQTATYLADQERQQMALAGQRQIAAFEDTLNMSADGIITLRAIRNEKNEIADFRIMQCNSSGMVMGHLPLDAVGRTLLEMLPQLKETGYFDIHKQVVETGIPFRAELPLNPDSKEPGWFMVSLSKMGDGLVSNFMDITPHKKLAQVVELQSKLLENIIENIPSAILLYEVTQNKEKAQEHFTIKLFNQRAEEFSGFTREELNRLSLEEIVRKRNLEPYYEKAKEVVLTGVPFFSEYYSQQTDKWFELSFIRVNRGLLMKFSNITRRKHQEIQLLEKNQLLDKVLNYSLTGISFMKAVRNGEGELIDLMYVEANQQVVDRSGLSKEELLRRSYLSIYPTAKEFGVWDRVTEVMKSGEPVYYQQYFRNENINAWFEISMVRVTEEYLLVNSNDITESVLMKQKLETTISKLKKTNKDLEEFTLAASHDMQEPLRKIQYFMNLLGERYGGQLTQEVLKIVKRAEHASIKMNRLIEELISYSKLGLNPASMKPVHLDEILQEVVSNLEVLIREKKATVHYSNLPHLVADEQLLKLAFQNLLSNALKYAHPDRRPEVQIVSSVVDLENQETDSIQKGTGMYHLIKVTDNGIGFDNEHAERIFNIFQRLHGNTEFEGLVLAFPLFEKLYKSIMVLSQQLGKRIKAPALICIFSLVRENE